MSLNLSHLQFDVDFSYGYPSYSFFIIKHIKFGTLFFLEFQNLEITALFWFDDFFGDKIAISLV